MSQLRRLTSAKQLLLKWQQHQQQLLLHLQGLDFLPTAATAAAASSIHNSIV